jgi:ABC-2 type transport system ATP-binding protein
MITISDLHKRFRKTEAVAGLSLEVPEGQVTAFLGPNGAGKSTTIKCLLNLHRPDSGSASVLGTDSRKLGPAQFKQIGYVSENMELPLWMTVKQFLDYCRPLYPNWDKAFEAQLLTQFDLPLATKLKDLSRGMRMKAALLSSLAYRPKLVVLDEPFSGLDPLVRDEFIRGLLELTEQEGWTVFVSSHDIEEVQRLAIASPSSTAASSPSMKRVTASKAAFERSKSCCPMHRKPPQACQRNGSMPSKRVARYASSTAAL